MKKIFILLILVFFTLFFGPLAPTGLAAQDCGLNPSSAPAGNPPDSITLGSGQLSDSKDYLVCFSRGGYGDSCHTRRPSGGYITISNIRGSNELVLMFSQAGYVGIRVLDGTVCESLFEVTGGFPQCTGVRTTDGVTQYDPGDTVHVNGTTEKFPANSRLYLRLTKPDGTQATNSCVNIQADGSFQGELQTTEAMAGNWRVDVYNATAGWPCNTVGNVLCSTTSFFVYRGTQPPPTAGPISGPCPGLEGEALDKCTKCFEGNDPATNGQPGAWTALGCISVEPSGFVAWLLQKVIGIAGGIAFLLIIYGGFQILTSAGDPEKLNTGKDIVVSAIAGLLMIVFSVLLLKIIGYDILRIPGFGGG